MPLGLRSAFAAPLLAVLLVSAGAVTGAVLAGVRSWRCSGVLREALEAASRWLSVGALLVIAWGTALPRDWPPPFTGGDLVLRPGDGGLARVPAALSHPGDLEAVLLLGNVGSYLVLAALLAFGTGRLRRSLLVCAVLSMLVELWQWWALERVAATDDWLLNVSGAMLGVLLVRLIAGSTPVL